MKVTNMREATRTVTLKMEDEPDPHHWAWHPLVRRFVWPIWSRLGLMWFITVDGKFYIMRWR